MLVFEFGDRLASTSAEDFVAEILGEQIGAAAVVTGEDFTFGKGRAGNAAVLRELGKPHGIAAETVAPVVLDGDAHLLGPDPRIARGRRPRRRDALLTRPFAVEAVVEHGDGRGHDLGWPTANLRLGNYQRPAYGIYAVRVRLDDGSEHDGVASLGIRPMFDPPEELLEANLFGFDGDLYGRTIEVVLHHYLRPEAKFEDLDALMSQMAQGRGAGAASARPSP